MDRPKTSARSEHTGSRRALPVVLIVEHDAFLAHALSASVRDAGIAAIIAATGPQAATYLAVGKWSGLVIDVGLPGGGGLSLVGAARAAHGTVPIVVMAESVEPQHTYAALEYGAMLLAKPLPPSWARVFAGAVTRGGRTSPRDALATLGLTRAQIEIFVLLMKGETAAGVASRLGVSQTTVRTHCANVYRDLRVHGLPEVLAMAAGWGPDGGGSVRRRRGYRG